MLFKQWTWERARDFIKGREIQFPVEAAEKAVAQFCKEQRIKQIFQVEADVKKDAEGKIISMTWRDVTKEEAAIAWEEFGLVVRVVYQKEQGDPDVD